MTVTFKRHAKATGLSSVGNPYPDVDIKLGGKCVGLISAPTWATQDLKWSIGFTVKSDDSCCGWKWIFLKARLDDEDQAREWVKNNIGKVQAKYQLHQMEK